MPSDSTTVIWVGGNEYTTCNASMAAADVFLIVTVKNRISPGYPSDRSVVTSSFSAATAREDTLDETAADLTDEADDATELDEV